jgi:hypothetical protein
VQTTFLLGWAADNDTWKTLLDGPGDHLLPSCQGPEFMRSTTPWVQSNHSLPGKLGMMPKLFGCLLGCNIRVDIWYRVTGLREEMTDGCKQVLSDMYSTRRVRVPGDDFTRTVVAKIGCQGII